MPKEIKELKCKICQFENGKHSFECPKYKEQKNPMKKELKEKIIEILGGYNFQGLTDKELYRAISQILELFEAEKTEVICGNCGMKMDIMKDKEANIISATLKISKRKENWEKNFRALAKRNDIDLLVGFVRALVSFHLSQEKQKWAKEIEMELDKLPTGHTPDGRTHWISISMEELEALKQKLKKYEEQNKNKKVVRKRN